MNGKLTLSSNDFGLLTTAISPNVMTADNGRDKSHCYQSINKTSKADSDLDTAVLFEVH
jgi:hypothetical protein